MTTFKPEIAGLRAIAVAIVILFHLNLEAFSGGFVGVDVFFVISGYLITRNILKDAAAGAFSFGRFYARRTRRILPALIFTVAVTYIIGALWCSPLMFLDVAKECTHALLSISNIQYWRESHQYFAPTSDQLALLHVWSLSLEEQFYLIWPVFIVFAQKLKRARGFIIFATVGSLASSIVLARFDASAVFFLTPFRIYEFGLGALMLFVERVNVARPLRELLSVSGVLGIAVSALTFRSSMPYLEVAMLVPCLGASAIILAGSKTRLANLLNRPVFLNVGAISYSLYLCHWPIIFFARFIFGEAADGFAATVLLCATMLFVAGGMYVFVERPFIQSSAYSNAKFARTVLQFWPVTLILAAVTHATFLSRGLPWRVPPRQEELARLQDFPTGEDIRPLYGPVAVALVGDSHAAQYDVGLSILLEKSGTSMEILGGSGCPILYGLSLSTHPLRKKCIATRDAALERLRQTSAPIIFNQFWSFYDDATVDYEPESGADTAPPIKGSYDKLVRALENTVEKFVVGGRRVLLIGSQVDANCQFNRSRLYQGPLPHAPLKPCPAGTRARAEKSGEAMNDLLARIQSKWPDRVLLLRPVDYLCNRSECPTMEDGLWLYFDGTHFSVAGSRYMALRAEAPLTHFFRK
jgi:peptidoglycan/LPS O-acetylase OafA/YrhL